MRRGWHNKMTDAIVNNKIGASAVHVVVHEDEGGLGDVELSQDGVASRLRGGRVDVASRLVL